jgi:CheY-like chemotaxis protein
MRGEEFVSRLRSLYPGTPSVIVTGSSRQEDIDVCYAAGAAGYLVKPLSVAGLEAPIEALERYWFTAVALPSAPRASTG